MFVKHALRVFGCHWPLLDVSVVARQVQYTRNAICKQFPMIDCTLNWHKSLVLSIILFKLDITKINHARSVSVLLN